MWLVSFSLWYLSQTFEFWCALLCAGPSDSSMQIHIIQSLLPWKLYLSSRWQCPGGSTPGHPWPYSSPGDRGPGGSPCDNAGSDITTLNEDRKGTTLSKYVRKLIKDNIPFNINWDIVKKAAPYNPITKICRLCISEKQHILFHPEDATLNQRSEFFSKCYHKEVHLLARS